MKEEHEVTLNHTEMSIITVDGCVELDERKKDK